MRSRNPLSSYTFPWLAWALLLLIPITWAGFRPSYFTRLDDELPTVIHLHFATMAAWLLMATAQPVLVRLNRIALHKRIGRISYAVMPVVLVTGYFLQRYSYQRALAGEEIGPPGFYPPELPLHIKAAEFTVIGSVYLCWLATYYLLGVWRRKHTGAHATYMTAAALTLLGPSGDRAIGQLCDAMGWPYYGIAEHTVFAVVFGFFLALAFRQAGRRQDIAPACTVLAIHAAGVLLYHLLPFSAFWNAAAAFLY